LGKYYRLAEEPGETGNEQLDNERTSHQRKGRFLRYNTQPLTLKRVRGIMLSQGQSIKTAPSVLRRLNAEIKSQDRFLNPKATYLATVIRSSSLYSRELSLVQWKAAYEEIYKAKHYQRAVQNRAVIPALKEEGQALLETIQADCHGRFRDAWQTMSRPDKASVWQRLAFWLLQNDPKLFLEFLVVTTEGKIKPDFTMVADCLLYLDNFYYADWLKDWKSHTHTYESLIEACLNPRDWPIVSVPQKGLRLYIRRASHEGVTRALEMGENRSVEMTAETALCYMWRFTEFRDVDQALKSLEYIPILKNPEFKLDSQGVLRHCCKLLTLDSVEDGDNGRNFRILPQLLKMGVRPDRDMMNLVLSNAYKTGDSQLGADMLQFMKNHAYDFDSYTYLTLLTEAVKRGDRGRVDSLIHELEGEEELLSNPYIANKIFHSHYVFTVKDMDTDSDPSGVFYSMLDMYNNLHDITPLKDLFIIPPQYTPRAGGSNTPPSPIALYIMIATFFRCQNRLSTVQRIYHRFRELVTQGHPSIAPLAETDHTYNEFLVAMRKNPRSLRSCVRVVEDMLHPPELPANSSTGEAMIHTKPTVRTWTILLSAFVFNRQSEAAEKIKEMMTKHRVKYDDSLWNTIVSGHVNQQNIPETAAAIKAMEEEGFSINPYTMKSLRYLRDPERLWVAIDELDKRVPDEGLEREASTPESESGSREDEKLKEPLIDSALKKLVLK
jgi:hypothetical protein